MDVGTILSVVQTVLGFLQCSELKELYSILGHQSQLKNLENTVNKIKDTFKDAEFIELSHEQQSWIEDLKYVVYDAEDLLDEFVTLAEQKKLKKGGKFTKKDYYYTTVAIQKNENERTGAELQRYYVNDNVQWFYKRDGAIKPSDLEDLFSTAPDCVLGLKVQARMLHQQPD